MKIITDSPIIKTQSSRLGEPDFSAYPWPGLMRCLYFTYQLNLPDLRGLVLSRIETLARRYDL